VKPILDNYRSVATLTDLGIQLSVPKE